MIYGLITISYLRDVVYEFIRDHGVCNYIGTYIQIFGGSGAH